jgi:hypothetical protein
MRFIDRHSRFTACALGLSLLAACGPSTLDGSSSSGATSAENGLVSFAVTDTTAQGIESFTLDLSGLQLGEPDGSLVNVLTMPVSVDFAALTDSSLLVQSRYVPQGTYTSASITFDYRNATCVLSGEGTPASIVGAGGAPVSGTITLDVHFDETPLEVLTGSQRVLQFDLDLSQSAGVDAAHNTVHFEPIVTVNVGGTGKKLLTYGTLLSVNAPQSTFQATLGTPAGTDFGTVNYVANSHTIYHLNGVPLVGAAGLALLATLPQSTPIQVLGSADASSSNIFASYVEAGRGTDNGGTDIVEGVVLNRLGNPSAGSNGTLQVFGRSRNALNTFFQFGTLFSVPFTFSNTKVVRTQSGQLLNTDDLSVGQRVRVYGTLNGNVIWANLPTSVIREQVVHLLGEATSSSAVPNGPTTLVMNLEQLELLPQNVFIWPNCGLTPPIPSALTVNAGVLSSPLVLAAGTPIEVLGYFASIADSQQDFKSSSIIDLDTAPSLLLVRNTTNGFTVTVTAGPTSIQLAIAGTPVFGETAIIDHGLAGFFPLPANPTPTLFPAHATGTYSLRDKQTGVVTAFVTFDSFSNALGNALSQGALLDHFGAVGVYASTTNSVQATQIDAVIE